MSMNVTIKAILVMLMRIVPTLMVRIIAHVRKDTPEMDTHVKVNKSGLHYFRFGTLTAPTTAPVRKDTPGTESHVEV